MRSVQGETDTSEWVLLRTPLWLRKEAEAEEWTGGDRGVTIWLITAQGQDLAPPDEKRKILAGQSYS